MVSSSEMRSIIADAKGLAPVKLWFTQALPEFYVAEVAHGQGGLSYGTAGGDIALPTSVIFVDVLPPTRANAPIAITAIRATARAYSTIVAPSSSLQSVFRMLIMAFFLLCMNCQVIG